MKTYTELYITVYKYIKLNMIEVSLFYDNNLPKNHYMYNLNLIFDL